MSKRRAVVTIDQYGRFAVRDKPFFPVGLYSVPREESFPELRRAGFNVVHSYEFSRTLYLNLQSREHAIKEFDGLGDEEAVQYLKAAADNHLMVFMGFNRPDGKSRDAFCVDGREQVRQRVLALRQQPGLLAWYIADEPDGQQFPPEWVGENRHIVESLDPAHPTATCLCIPDKFEQYAETGQVLMYDPYPVPDGPLRVVGENLARLKKMVGPSRATIAVIQAFDWKSYDWTRRDTRPPTLQELRCMTYQAIASDVSGILYFNYHNEIHSNRAADNPEGWLTLSAVAHELQTLMPALLAPATEDFSFEGEINACARDVGGETWVLGVNPNSEPGQATFTLPGGAAKATVFNYFNAPACFVAQKHFQMDFEPYGVRALRICSA